jgi:AcrR family transcriptional regulator
MTESTARPASRAAAGLALATQPPDPAPGAVPGAAGPAETGVPAETGIRAAEAGGHRARGSTRARIQEIAVGLFTEQGYDKTSLREIAEALGVTKAALYYHFKSKEDIVRSLLEDYFGQIDALVTWAQGEPPTAETRAEILRRYVSIVAEGEAAFRMLHQNQAAVQGLASSKNTGELFRERLGSLIALLTGPGAPLQERLRAAMAIGGISMGWMMFSREMPDRDALSAAVVQVATEIAAR